MKVGKNNEIPYFKIAYFRMRGNFAAIHDIVQGKGRGIIILYSCWQTVKHLISKLIVQNTNIWLLPPPPPTCWSAVAAVLMYKNDVYGNNNRLLDVLSIVSQFSPATYFIIFRKCFSPLRSCKVCCWQKLKTKWRVP